MCDIWCVHLSCPLQLTLYLRLLAEYPATKTATGVEITVPLPRSVQRVHCETGGCAGSWAGCSGPVACAAGWRLSNVQCADERTGRLPCWCSRLGAATPCLYVSMGFG